MLKDADKHLSASHRRRVWIFTIVLFLLSASLGGCSKGDDGSGGNYTDDPDGGGRYALVEFESENPHFETPNLIDTAPSYWYWLAAGDELAPAYDTFEMHFEREGKMCDFLDNTPASPNGEDCLAPPRLYASARFAGTEPDAQT